MSSYDVIIVGAGSAGCVMANRLSEDPGTSVLLIEAGPPDTDDLIHIPAGFAALFRSDKDWDHSTVWEPHLNNRRIYLPRGRTLGGSSSTNAMIYIRGNRLDYDEWRDTYGCTGWGWDDLLPCFKRAEDNVRGANDLHGQGGPLHVDESKSNSPLAKLAFESAVRHGLPVNEDFNGEQQDGVGYYQLTQRNGARGSAAVSYLHPVMDRPNLTVETNCQVLKVNFDGTRATGVTCKRLNDLLEFHAGEVVLCGGAYNSPQLLMLSGIGRGEELSMLMIDPVAELPGVGMNLHDHPASGPIYKIEEELSLFGALNEENLALFESEGRGPLTSNVAEAGGFLRTSEGLAAPDVQFHFASAIFGAEGLMPATEHGLTLSVCVLKPRSRGFVTLGSPDPTAKPIICHNYFEDPEDMAEMVRGFRVCMEIAKEEPLSTVITGPHLLPESDSDEDIAAHVRTTCQTLYHPVGTCKMGTDDMAVVDLECRVHGVEGLRIVDASIMPAVPRGNTNAPTIAVAEHAADMMLSGKAATSGSTTEAPAAA